MQLLSEARTFVKQGMNGDGVQCPCCDQFAKIYKRNVFSSMALCLIEFYKIEKKHGPGYYRIQDLRTISAKHTKAIDGSGTFAKLALWDLIIEQEKPKERSETKTSGRWMLTEKGKKFVENSIKVPKYCLTYNGCIYGYEGELVSIKDCLSEKFNYEKLMSR